MKKQGKYILHIFTIIETLKEINLDECSDRELLSLEMILGHSLDQVIDKRKINQQKRKEAAMK